MKSTNNFLNQPSLRLLPQYFKIIGLGVIVGCVLFLIAVKLFHIELMPVNKAMIKTIMKDVFIIGLVFLSFSKDKIEDELTILLRMKALSSGVFFGFTNFIVADLMGAILKEPIFIQDMGAFTIITQILLWYIIFYQLAKLSR